MKATKFGLIFHVDLTLTNGKEPLTDFHGDEAKKIQNGRLTKIEFFKTANSQYFFVKILEIGPWVSRTCEGHLCG